MGAIVGRAARPGRADDPRVVRSRAAAVEAARTVFLDKGFAGATMEEIAAAAGLTKRTLYNLYDDKDALFRCIIGDVIAYAGQFARGLREDFPSGITRQNLQTSIQDLGQRLAIGIVRPEVVAVRRLLIGETRSFPALATEYFDRAPGQVIDALAEGFARLGRRRLLRVSNARRAGAQFAYLVSGEPLDRAILTGIIPPRTQIVSGALEGVETFMARYGPREARTRRSPTDRSRSPDTPRARGRSRP
jgi:TetR/AcrR family transcriptional repressor of mexJK operon